MIYFNNQALTKIFSNVANFSDSLATIEIAATVRRTNEVLTQINRIAEKINRGEGSLGMLLYNDTLYANLESSTYHLNRLLKDLHENPKRYLHFSLLDLGRTVYVVDDKGKKKLTAPPK